MPPKDKYQRSLNYFWEELNNYKAIWSLSKHNLIKRIKDYKQLFKNRNLLLVKNPKSKEDQMIQLVFQRDKYKQKEIR